MRVKNKWCKELWWAIVEKFTCPKADLSDLLVDDTGYPLEEVAWSIAESPDTPTTMKVKILYGMIDTLVKKIKQKQNE